MSLLKHKCQKVTTVHEPKYLMRCRKVIFTQNYSSKYCRDLLLQIVPFIMLLNMAAAMGFPSEYRFSVRCFGTR